MSLDGIKNFITSNAARQVLVAQKHSPKILFAAGTVGVVTAGVLACRSTLKLDEVLSRADTDIEKAKALHTKVDGDAYSDTDLSKDLTKIKVRTGLEIAKLYSPAIMVGIVSIAALTGSHVVLTRRNGAAMAAYAGLDRAYKEYRERVKNEYGSEIDRKFATGAEPVVVEEKLADGTTKTTTTDQVKKDGKFGGSPYSVVFDEQSKYFSTEPGRNAMTIQMKQNWANDKLRAKGFLFLNDVYEMLGLPETKAGQCVGWVYRKENEPKTGDNYVDFGVFNGDPEWVEAFVDGSEKYVILDFNVDGMILDLI